MSSRPSTFRKPTNLSIRPPSPSHNPPSLHTPNNPTSVFGYNNYTNNNNNSNYSPRKAPLPPSPTYSNYSYASGSTNTRGSSGVGAGRGDEVPPPVPAKNDKRLPGLPLPLPLPSGHGHSSGGSGGGSPHRSFSGVNVNTAGGRGLAATGVYDNKLVSSTLSHLPPLPPLSPTPTGTSSTHGLHPTASSTHLLAHSSSSISPRPSISHPSSSSMSNTLSSGSMGMGAIGAGSQSLSASVSVSALGSGLGSHPHSVASLNYGSGGGGSSGSGSGSTGQGTSSGVVVFPDGTPLSDHSHLHSLHSLEGLVGRVAESMTMAHSSPNSPWSLLTVHVLPLFAGSALKTPLEDLNHLCHSHIIATSQRSPPSRIIALLTSDLREFIASGMLTLKAKFETLEEGKVVSRAAEVWSFFWTQVLPYVEGVFLPFTQLRDVPTSSNSTYLTALSSPIPVRHLLLSGFLLHILLPLLPRLIPQITSSSSPSSSSNTNTTFPPPTPQELNRILQMSLVLSTQARYSTFFPSTSGQSSDGRDEEVREKVESLGKYVRWRVQQNELEALGEGGLAAGTGTGTANSPIKSLPIGVGAAKQSSLQRGPSLSQSGRYRRRGWRASANLGMGLSQFGSTATLGGNGPPGAFSGQNSGEPNATMVDRWGRPRLEEEDEDDYLMAPPRIRTDTSDSISIGSTLGVASGLGTMLSSTAGGSILTGGSTIRGESLASYGETATPTAIAGVGAGATSAASVNTSGTATPGTGTGGAHGHGQVEMMYGRPTRRMRAESEGSEISRRDKDRDRRI